MSAPNLDCMNHGELVEFWSVANRNPTRVARSMFPDRPNRYVTAVRDLGHYASNKAAAVLCRSEGRIQDAQYYERICDFIYDKLPKFARW